MRTTPIFDPLRFLERQLRLKVHLQQAMKVLEVYDKLLRMQLDAPTPELHPSVSKLIAHGKIVIKQGKYVLP